jgi:hypothetical protein
MISNFHMKAIFGGEISQARQFAGFSCTGVVLRNSREP